MNAIELLTKPLKVGEFVITSRMIRATFATVRGPAGFVSGDLQSDLYRAGASRSLHQASEAANRLLQRFRKLGLVTFRHGYWWPVEGELDALLATEPQP